MKKELMISLMVLLLVLIGCSNDAPSVNEIDSDVSDATDSSVNDLNNDEVEVQEANNQEADDQKADDQVDMMTFCENTKQTELFKYEYYWTDKEYFEKVVVGNGGETHKIVTPETSCVLMKGSSVDGWDCSDSSEALFQESKGVIKDLINSPADIYGFVCEEVPYDSSVFTVN